MGRLVKLGLIWLGLVILLVVGLPTSSAFALSEEQELVAEVWRIVNRAYVDESFNHQNWWFIRQRILNRPFSSRQETYEAIQEMLASLEDPYTRLLTPDQYRSLQTTTSGELTGEIGRAHV